MDAVIVVGTIVLACWVVSATLRWLMEGDPPALLARLHERVLAWRAPQSGPSTEAVTLLELELSRISERLQAEYLSSQPAKAERIRAWMIAYDRVLLELCETTSLTPPRTSAPLSAAERFCVEHALVGSGCSW